MRDFSRYLEQELPAINTFISQEIAKLDPLVAPAADHVLSAGGKRLRPMLTILTARAAMGADTLGERIYPLACSLEFLHSATLLHDDILDGAALRRGKTAAHLVFSRTETVLAGDVLLALANCLVADYGDPRLTRYLSDAIMQTAVGEVAEIANLRKRDYSQETYLDIITGKTARLMEAACATGAMLAGADEKLVAASSALGLNLGIAFQIVDDALDYASPSSVTGKPAGGDLREGKLTLPLILYMEGLDAGERDALLAELGSLSEAKAQRVLAAIQEGDCIARTRQAAQAYVDQARDALEAFPPSTEKDLVAESLDFVVAREK